MANLPLDLDFVSDPSATPERMNRAMLYLLTQIQGLQLDKNAFDELLAQIQQIGLNRLNDALTPLYNRLVSITNLGALLQATSSTELTISTGAKTFQLDAGQWSSFAPSRWMVAMSADATQAMGGLVTSYDMETGTLVLNVMVAFGTGSGSSWQISPSCPPLLGAPVVDGGDEDAAPSQTSIPYIYDGPIGAARRSYRTVTAAGPIQVLATDMTILVKKDVGEATIVNLPPSESRNGWPLTVKDLKGDANINNITFVPAAGETIDGYSAAGASANGIAVIDIELGKKTLDPLPSGGWIL